MVAYAKQLTDRQFPHLDNESEREPNRVIAIAASMGGIKALKSIVAALPAELPAAIVIVQHLSPKYKSHLAEIIDRKSPLKASEATEGVRLRASNIYVAPPDRHIIINHDGTLSLSDAPKKHFVRPSAEYTFQSLAKSYKERAIAIVLTGCDGDGKEGVRVVSEMGGKVIAQNRETAEAFSMPENAIDTGCVNLVLPLDEIADGIVSMVYS